MTRPRPVKACVFDAYGTLFDVHAPAAALASELGEKGAAISAQWRTKQLEYTWLRSLMGRYADFAQVTADALDYVLAANGLSGSPVRERLLSLYTSLAAYPDAAPCLTAVKNAGARTGILSNGSPAMLAAAVTSAKLGAPSTTSCRWTRCASTSQAPRSTSSPERVWRRARPDRLRVGQWLGLRRRRRLRLSRHPCEPLPSGR